MSMEPFALNSEIDWKETKYQRKKCHKSLSCFRLDVGLCDEPCSAHAATNAMEDSGFSFNLENLVR